ncbi:MAG: DNA mismatch repair endonuclease MutL [Chromatiales bacterium]
MRVPIELLPDFVISQIAAGEVIERPASVLKELVENSLDAGARHIEVECERGGMHLIRIRDDGIGIPRNEMRLALSRHATSKLRALADLSTLATLGFRGEALPSIGAVARLAVTSCTDVGEGAWRIAVDGSARVEEPQPAAHPPGTTVEVRDLFFNVPARRRFLKSERTEFLHLQEWLRRTALAAFDVGLSLLHNGQRLFTLQPAGMAAEQTRRVEKLCGAPFARAAHALECQAGEMRVRGWIAPAEAARNQSNLQYWFVNDRPVRDPRLQHATRLAYDDTLPPGRHPACVLYLEIDPALVDVNVHPAKTEVRFADPRRVHDFVLSALRRALRTRIVAAGVPGLTSKERPARAAGVREPEQALYASGASTAADVAGAAAPEPWGGQALTLFAGGMLLARSGDALLVIDAVRARAELFSQRLATQLEAGTVVTRPLIFPLPLEVDVRGWEFASQCIDKLTACGLETEAAGPGHLLLRAVPAVLAESPPRVLIDSALAWLAAQWREIPLDCAELLRAVALAAARAQLPQTAEAMTRLLRELEAAYTIADLTGRRLVRRIEAKELRELLGPRR